MCFDDLKCVWPKDRTLWCMYDSKSITFSGFRTSDVLADAVFVFVVYYDLQHVVGVLRMPPSPPRPPHRQC